MIAITCLLLMKSKKGELSMGERKIKKKRRINVEELINREVKNVILTERNKPNINLMAKALLDLMKQK